MASVFGIMTKILGLSIWFHLETDTNKQQEGERSRSESQEARRETPKPDRKAGGKNRQIRGSGLPTDAPREHRFKQARIRIDTVR